MATLLRGLPGCSGGSPPLQGSLWCFRRARGACREQHALPQNPSLLPRAGCSPAGWDQPGGVRELVSPHRLPTCSQSRFARRCGSETRLQSNFGGIGDVPSPRCLPALVSVVCTCCVCCCSQTSRCWRFPAWCLTSNAATKSSPLTVPVCVSRVTPWLSARRRGRSSDGAAEVEVPEPCSGTITCERTKKRA